jgi:hypothetical protein
MGSPRIRDEEDPYEHLFTREEEEPRRDYHRPPYKSRRQREIEALTKTDAAEQDVNLMARRWKNRRRMAWLSLIVMFTMTGLVFFTDLVPNERMQVLKEPLTWFYFACISVVGAYMGFTTWASRK